jgi:rhamnose utilization protein RhaD (predicted bifunctional aldolase and dehydrogenase)
VVLDNHGIIIVGQSIDQVEALIGDVEQRLELSSDPPPRGCGDSGIGDWQRFEPVSGLAHDSLMLDRVVAGTYYPDHVVFLGPALPVHSAQELAGRPLDDFAFPAAVVPGNGVFLKQDATPAQRAMLQCLYDVLSRVPKEWTLDPIGKDAEAELLNWDAEKYRQMLAKRR